ncbi:hypothetical protein BDV06DRAFT_228662 [Aspergillus oleicola]
MRFLSTNPESTQLYPQPQPETGLDPDKPLPTTEMHHNTSYKHHFLAATLQHTLDSWSEGDREPFYETYKDLHQNPGVSGDEDYGAGRVVGFLETLKAENYGGIQIDIHRDIGNGDGNEIGPSVVAVFRNGKQDHTEDGNGERIPAVLLRADIDGLPVQEQTDLPYASQIPGVMHAYGHDLHITALLAAVTALHAKDCWSGALIAVFQPSEETGAGAVGMINDNLYAKIGVKYAPSPSSTLGPG